MEITVLVCMFPLSYSHYLKFWRFKWSIICTTTVCMPSHVYTACIFTYFIDRVVNLVQKERKTVMRGVIMKGKTLYHCYLLKCQPKYVWPDYSCSHSTESWHGMRFSLSMPLQIFSMAGLTCALCCACVCRSWKEIVDHPLMWNRVCGEKGCSSVTTYVRIWGI